MDEISAFGPGRVELLGNHTDYNGGFVLSAAIDRGVTVLGRAQEGGQITLRSGVMSDAVEAQLEELQPLQQEEDWANYPLGVAKMLRDAGYKIGGFEASITSDLPLGAGLSSSAALEVGTAVFLKKLYDLQIEPMELAKLCRRAENEFAGVNCGLLDQVTSVFGKAGHILFLDCRAEQVRTVPLPPEVTLLVTHSGIKHSLVAGEYNERRARCFEAAEKLGVPELRDASLRQLEQARQQLEDVTYRRALHVVGENARVLEAVEALERQDVEMLGRLMYASHESSRVNFENSIPELDELVEIACGLDGVLGSRLTGGGFGGATVALVRQEAAEDVRQEICRHYEREGKRSCHTYLFRASDGAR